MSDNIHSHKHTLRNLEDMSQGPSVPLPAIIDAQAGFALNLLRENSLNASSIMSPISISIALAMVYLGAKENTAAQIRDTIAKGASEDEIHAHFSSVLSLINSNELNVTLESANRVYVKTDYKLIQTYVDGIKKHYAGELEEIDFTKSQDAASKINAFVEKATHEKITNLISADSLNADTRLVLINAIYFKGQWNKQFSKSLTHDADFYSSPEKTQKVKMMELETNLPYYENDDYQVVGLPYTGEQVTMYIILPKERFGLENLVKNLNGSTLAQLLAKKGRSQVKVLLPRFKIESEFNLNGALKSIGISDAFTDDADFSGMAQEKLQVSDVIHKAFIETNEDGSEAAAATGVVVRTRMRPVAPPVVPKFEADHAFLYVVKDSHGSILFIGNYLA